MYMKCEFLILKGNANFYVNIKLIVDVNCLSATDWVHQFKWNWAKIDDLFVPLENRIPLASTFPKKTQFRDELWLWSAWHLMMLLLMKIALFTGCQATSRLFLL